MAEDLASLWAKGGWPMYPLTLLGMLAVGCAVLFPILSFSREGKNALLLAGLAFALGGLGIAAGFGAEAWGMEAARRAVMNVNPADKDLILLAAQTESEVCRLYAFLYSLLPLASGALLLTAGTIKGGVESLVIGGAVAAGVLAVGLMAFGSMVVARQQVVAQIEAAVEARR